MQPTLFPSLPPRPRAHRNLFFALLPDDAARAAMFDAAESLRAELNPRGRWIKPHRYHLTLRWLGEHAELPEPLVALAMRAADRVRVPAFDLVLDEAGSFRNRSIPWWLGASRDSEGLQALARELAEAFRALGSPAKDERLVPHVTILRDADRLLEPTPVEPIRWRISGFVLIDSVLSPRPEHTILRRWPL